ncbi:cupin domain-containing protein [Flagellimonas sp. S174]|uniref:cupin domain-containing protein n=1 Tax=Flagellimonas sp. S174 TaxID=3410790 RepID=UPI003BF49421
MKKNRKNSEHYLWGENCEGWHLVKGSELSVIEELMPSKTEEAKHYHSKAQQLFYVLKGEATFQIESEIVRVPSREGIHIQPNLVHQIRNEGETDLEFLVISQPTTRGDRTNVNNIE